MDVALEHVARDRAADQGGSDVVEETREHKNDGEQRNAASPAIRKKRRHLIGYVTLLEVAGKDGEAHQQQEQVRQDHPLVLHVPSQAGEPGAELEAGEDELVEEDCSEPRQRDLKRSMMEDRHAYQRQREEDEIDRNAEHEYRRHRRRPGTGLGGCPDGGRSRSENHRPRGPGQMT